MNSLIKNKNITTNVTTTPKKRSGDSITNQFNKVQIVSQHNQEKSFLYRFRQTIPQNNELGIFFFF